jgi:hypothetical protein|tara:strand:+ start:4940 stop:5416 length:477 start_codon:yes stop_codon:yes gene_type:complete
LALTYVEEGDAWKNLEGKVDRSHSILRYNTHKSMEENIRLLDINGNGYISSDELTASRVLVPYRCSSSVKRNMTQRYTFSEELTFSKAFLGARMIVHEKIKEEYKLCTTIAEAQELERRIDYGVELGMTADALKELSDEKNVITLDALKIALLSHYFE